MNGTVMVMRELQFPKPKGLWGKSEMPSWDDRQEMAVVVSRDKSVAEWDGKAPAGDRAKGARLIAVNTGYHDLSLIFPGAKEDGDGHQWDVVFACTFNVDANHIKNLIQLFGAKDTGIPQVEDVLPAQIEQYIHDAFADHTLPELRDRAALPVSWWTAKLSTPCLEHAGLAVTVQRVRWKSEEAARAKQEEADALEDARKERLKQRQHDATCADKARAQELVEKELGYMKIKAGLEEDVLRARGWTEEQVREKTRRERAAIDQVGQLPGQIVADLVSGDAATRHQAREQAVSPEYGIDPHDLPDLGGYDADVQILTRALHDKGADGRVTLLKEDLGTSSIGPRDIAVNTLRIGQPLAFKLKAGRAGYLTFLDIGVDGVVYVAIPGCCSPHNVQVSAGAWHSIPGEELFRANITENGPPGWHHLAVIVSDTPLLGQDIVSRSSKSAPAVPLTPDNATALHRELAARAPDSWSASVLSFRAVE